MSRWLRAFEELRDAATTLRASADPRAELSAETRARYATSAALLTIDENMALLDDVSLFPRLVVLRGDLMGGAPVCAESLARELEGILNQVILALSRRKFVYIPPPGDDYLEQDKLFGDAVYAAFPAARSDVKDAGNCIAAGLYTAAIFHLIRASEYGLRGLAVRLRVRLRDKGKPQLLEFADWNKIIEGCKNKIKEARLLPKGPKQHVTLERYSRFADHSEYMKDIWRNNISHTRPPYSQFDALSVMEKVNAFMELLADSGISHRVTAEISHDKHE